MMVSHRPTSTTTLFSSLKMIKYIHVIYNTEMYVYYFVVRILFAASIFWKLSFQKDTDLPTCTSELFLNNWPENLDFPLCAAHLFSRLFC